MRYAASNSSKPPTMMGSMRSCTRAAATKHVPSAAVAGLGVTLERSGLFAI